MKSTKNALGYYSNRLGKDEMINYYAGEGDTLPEVIVSSSYTKVHGMSYYSWLFLHPSFNTIPQVVENLNGWDSWGGIDGGGGGGGSQITYNSNSDFDNLLNALGLGAAVNGTTWDLFSKLMAEGKILSNLANYAGALGVALNFAEVGNKFLNGGWSVLTTNEQIILTFAFIGTAGLLASIAPSALIGSGLAAGIGLVGIGADFLGLAFDIWRLSNPGQEFNFGN